MTVREAVELVLEATVLGTTSDAGDAIYVLDMGEPVKIIDLARQMIRLAGLEPERDIEIKITGLRPGEKLTEQLFHAGEGTEPTRYSGVLIARPRVPERARLIDGFEVLARTARARNRAEMLDALAELVPEYSPPAEAPPARRAAGP
jgi:O-antigen biosynthesis protein WbqV